MLLAMLGPLADYERLDATRITAGAEDALRSLSKASDYWVWELDMAGCVTSCTSEIQKTLGYDPREVIGTSFFDYIDNLDRARVRSRFSRPPANDCHCELIDTLKRTKSGVPVRVRSFVFRRARKDGWAGGFFVMDHLSAPELEVLTVLNRALAHELNNLLAIILGETELLCDISDPQQIQELITVQRSATTASILNSEAACFHGLLREPQLLNVSVVMEKAGLLLPCILGRHTSLVIHTDPALGSLKVDAGRLYLLLTVICLNARQRLHNDCALRIAASRVDFDNVTTAPDGSSGAYLMIVAGAAVRPETVGPFEIRSVPGLERGLEILLRPLGGFLYDIEAPTEAAAQLKVLLPIVIG